jgi:hypothetical protein
MIKYLSESDLLAGLDAIRNAPQEQGKLDLIVIRPNENERVILAECTLSERSGVEGDGWAQRCKKTLPDGSLNPDTQVAIMNSRCIALLTPDWSRWPLAGDQLYIDLDLSADNLPVGQRLAVGSAVLQITGRPHTGCIKFAERYGPEALKLVNSPLGAQLHLRGVYAQVIQDGLARSGDTVTKI